MKRIMLRAKIHDAIVTQSDLEYEGSLTMDVALMEAGEMFPYEQIHVYNITNGERFITYLIKGERDSGVIGINGAAAHKAKPGDRLIIAAYSSMSDDECSFYRPLKVMMGQNNKIKEVI